MAIDQSKLKTTKYPGVFKMPDGRLLAKCSIRTPEGKVVVRKQVMREGATEVDTVNAVEALKDAFWNPNSRSTPTHLPPAMSQTVENYSVSWLATRKESLKPSTIRTYEIDLSHHILPRLGYLTCAEVNRQAVEGWTNWALRQTQPAEFSMQKNIKGELKTFTYANPHAGEPYTQESMRQWWRVLKAFLQDMAADHGLALDPTIRVKPPTRSGVHEKKREQRVLDMDMIGALLEAAREHCAKRYAEIALIVLTGMRPGEVYGLMWECVDFTNGEIDVRRAVSDGVLEESTKNGSRRTASMHPHMVEVLQAHRQLQLQENHKAKLATGLVFPSDAATLRDSNSLDDSFEKLCNILDIDINLGNQVMRRSINTNLLTANVERLIVRSQIGHTTEPMSALYFKAHAADKAAAVARIPIRRRREEKE